MAVLIENLANRLIAQQLAIEQCPKCALYCHDDLGVEAAPFQARRVYSDQASAVTPSNHCIGRHVLSDFRACRNEGMGTNTAELMHAAHTCGHYPFLDYAMASDFRRVCDNSVVTDLTIVCDMGVVHQQYMASDARN